MRRSAARRWLHLASSESGQAAAIIASVAACAMMSVIAPYRFALIIGTQ
jgi:hypothetical protein